MNVFDEAAKAFNLSVQDLQFLHLGAFTKKKTYLCAFNKNDLLFVYTGKTRFVSKDAFFVDDLVKKLEKIKTKKYLFTKSPLCSKARRYLEEKGFYIYAFV
ncbi:tram-like protein [Campylobacter sp. MIT 21-1685]|uniref:tram-like protein n=1 Tax=unclassified Campylobacter TaxID=2593542 RepID=UPI00224AA135|nr:MULTISPECIES: tram-like protein [unclassified Campylobacter]MCX2682450.1 tram-like protein [Campylobacter sp. MIT 21-1684]MCX2750837.1 tram-like protein [Campylobacter sp. MIT 21-1682]MCX2806931.1 tram-like protein [Campylobacter sp. MIT 21-1685]